MPEHAIYKYPPGPEFPGGYTWMEHSQSSDECLEMVRDTLSRLGCCHGHDGSATPPMMYAEWIACVVAKREKRILELEALLKSHGPPFP